MVKAAVDAMKRFDGPAKGIRFSANEIAKTPSNSTIGTIRVSVFNLQNRANFISINAFRGGSGCRLEDENRVENQRDPKRPCVECEVMEFLCEHKLLHQHNSKVSCDHCKTTPTRRSIVGTPIPCEKFPRSR